MVNVAVEESSGERTVVVVTPAVVWVVLAAAVVSGAEVVEVLVAAVVVLAAVLVEAAEVEVEAEEADWSLARRLTLFAACPWIGLVGEVKARGLTEFWAAIVVGGRGNVVVEPDVEVDA